MSASCQKRTYAAQQSEMLRSAGPGHDKLWREGQVASVRYSLLNGGKNFLGIGMVHLAAAPSVFHHILDHRQQSAIRVGTGGYLNVYVGENSSAPLTVKLPSNIWRPTNKGC